MLNTTTTTTNKDFISRGHSFDMLIFREGLKLKENI